MTDSNIREMNDYRPNLCACRGDENSFLYIVCVCAFFSNPEKPKESIFSNNYIMLFEAQSLWVFLLDERLECLSHHVLCLKVCTGRSLAITPQSSGRLSEYPNCHLNPSRPGLDISSELVHKNAATYISKQPLKYM